MSEGEAPWLFRSVDVAGIQTRPVRADSAHADGARVDPATQLVHAAPGVLPGHPPLAGHRHAPVERHGGLVDDPRTTALEHREVAGVDGARAPGGLSFDDLDVDP